MAPPGPRDIGSEKSLHKMDKYFLLRAKRIKLSGLCNDEQDHFGNWHGTVRQNELETGRVYL